jgi:hypothetical protein
MIPRVLQQFGNYSLVRSDPMYEAYSGYAFLIFHTSSPFCAPKQLQGFALSQEKAAIERFHVISRTGKEDKEYEAIRLDIKAKTAKGWLPCPYDDPELRAHLVQRGLQVMATTSSHEWFGKPEPTLFTLEDKP